jgi:hypothetical protein
MAKSPDSLCPLIFGVRAKRILLCRTDPERLQEHRRTCHYFDGSLSQKTVAPDRRSNRLNLLHNSLHDSLQAWSNAVNAISMLGNVLLAHRNQSSYQCSHDFPPLRSLRRTCRGRFSKRRFSRLEENGSLTDILVCYG